MELTCVKCGCFCGTVRDATLKKGLVIMCGDCNQKRVAKELMDATAKHNNMNDIFGDIFGKGR